MRILITGMAGFVGRHLLGHLIESNAGSNCRKEDGLEILGADIAYKNFPLEKYTKKNKNISIERIDLRQKKEVEKLISAFLPEQIYHLAAQSSVSYSWENPVETFGMNVFGGINIFEAVKKYCRNCRVLVTCTAEEYDVGHNPQNRPVPEDFKIYPKNPYAISKAALDFFATTFQKANDLNIFVSRSFNHTGPGQSPRFVTSDFAKQISEIEKGLKEPVINAGNLNVYRDFLDVRDVVMAYTSILKKGAKGQVYNVCSGKRIKIAEILDILLSLSSAANIKISIDKNKIRPIDSASIFGDNTRIREHTGWQPKYDIKESLSDTLNWWRERSV